MIHLKSLLLSLFIALFGGGVVGILTMGSQGVYKSLKLPSFSPPSFIFPIVWSILYVLMAVSSYMVYESGSKIKKRALFVYGLQLLLNFIWPIIFFNTKMYWLAFFLLAFLLILVLAMIYLFYKVRPLVAYLQIPYVLWLLFAGYLNFMVAALNM